MAIKSKLSRIPDRLYFRIGEVSKLIGIKPYVLRYWETEFNSIAPEKSRSGQRVYKRGDVETIVLIKQLLYEERYSIAGAKRRIADLRRQGELKTARQEAVEAPEPELEALAGEQEVGQADGAARVAEILSVVHELRAMVSASVSELFRF
jgi:DNA-binding transcriptional MerR regulator